MPLVCWKRAAEVVAAGGQVRAVHGEAREQLGHRVDEHVVVDLSVDLTIRIAGDPGGLGVEDAVGHGALRVVGEPVPVHRVAAQLVIER